MYLWTNESLPALDSTAYQSTKDEVDRDQFGRYLENDRRQDQIHYLLHF